MQLWKARPCAELRMALPGRAWGLGQSAGPLYEQGLRPLSLFLL